MAIKPLKKTKKVAPKKAAPIKKSAPVKKAPVKKVAAKAPAKSAAKPKPAPKSASPAERNSASSASRTDKTRAASKPKSSTGSYTQSEFLENVKAFCGFAKRSEAKELVEDLSTLIKDTLKKGYKIPFFGLGKMYVRTTKARTGRNPATGEEMAIPAKKRVRFAPAKALKEAVL